MLNYKFARLLQERLKIARGLDTSLRMKHLWYRRNSKIDNIIKLVSKRIIDYSIKHKINKITIGYNKGWKNNVNMGKNNNRKFYHTEGAIFKNYKSII